MNEELLKQHTVRVATSYKEKVSVGSGVIIQNSQNMYFVITAEHCVFGKKGNRLTNIKPENISVEHKSNNEDAFVKYNVKNITHCDESQDIAVLEVENVENRNNKILFTTFSNLESDESLHFRGYPKWLHHKSEADNYKCTLKSTDKSKFIIKSDDITDATAGQHAQNTAGGLSGSGVFLFRDNQIHLLGIVTDLRDEDGMFGHLVCQKLHGIFDLLNCNSTPLNSPKSLLKWSNKIDEQKISQQIAELEESNNDDFKNLMKKCTVLYEESAYEMAYRYLENHFKAEINIYNIENNNAILFEAFEDVAYVMRNKVKDVYNNREVSNKTEAQIILGDIFKICDELFKEQQVQSMKSTIISDSSRSVITKLLLNCDLNFVKK